MSHTRKRTTPEETTEIEGRAISSEEYDAIFKNLPWVIPEPPIAILMDTYDIEYMAELLLNEKTTLPVEDAEKVLGQILEIKDTEGAESFYNVVREIWPKLGWVVRKAMDKLGFVMALVIRYANDDSAAQRWASMMADPALESSLANENSEIGKMRLFLSILIGYWGDYAELPKLDAAMGRRQAFGFFINFLDNIGKEVKRFSYEIKDAKDANDVGRVREWLLTQYANDENVDVDDFLEKIKSVLLSHVKTGEDCGHFDGSTAIVNIRVPRPWSFSVSIKLVDKDVWF